MSDRIATPSIRITRIHGKNTYVDQFGHLHADRIYYEGDTPESSGYDIPAQLCPDCHGIGISPCGEPCGLETSWHVSLGFQACDEDGELLENKTCLRCDGSGVIPDGMDPAEHAADLEYHLRSER